MRLRALLVPLAALWLLVVAPRSALAIGPTAPVPSTPAAQPPAPPAPDRVAPDSPRASVKRFLELCRAGELAEAAAYLDLSDAQKADGPQLARRLKAILDRHMWGKLESISPLSSGEADDHLPAGVEQIGSVPGPSGPEPVRLVRRHFPDGTRWIFSRSTVERIDAWYGRLLDRWQEDYFPEPLLRTGPKDLLYWQWIALPVLFLLALGAGNVLAWLTRKALSRIVARTKNTWDDALLARLGAPLTLTWAVAAVDLALPRLALYPPAHAFIDGVVRAGFFAGVVWILVRSVDVAAARILDMPNAKSNPAARSLVPLGAKSLKVVLVVFAALAGLSELGVAVGSLLAGLGIGGVAIALAAQKTVENLFGSLSIGIDQPFRVGDFVTVDTITGTVESIGLRSTRIRTQDRTLVTMPNGKLADMRVESFAGRDRIRFGCTLALAQGTRTAQVRAVLDGVRTLLKERPRMWPDVTVALAKVSDASLDVEVLAWFQTTSWDEFLRLREDALLSILDVVEQAGVQLSAMPRPTPPAKP